MIGKALFANGSFGNCPIGREFRMAGYDCDLVKINDRQAKVVRRKSFHLQPGSKVNLSQWEMTYVWREIK